MIYSVMVKLEKKFIECLNTISIRRNYVKSQSWDAAASIREQERILKREFHNIINNSQDNGFNWDIYEETFRNYCDFNFGITDVDLLLKTLNRNVKLKQIGI